MFNLLILKYRVWIGHFNYYTANITDVFLMDSQPLNNSTNAIMAMKYVKDNLWGQ